MLNKIEAMYGRSDVNVKVVYVYARLFTLRLYFINARQARSGLRPYARKNYATVEIQLGLSAKNSARKKQ